jgi:hypothetical protein
MMIEDPDGILEIDDVIENLIEEAIDEVEMITEGGTKVATTSD